MPLLLVALVGGMSLTAYADSGTHAKTVVKGGTLTLHGFTSGAKSINVASKKNSLTSTYSLSLAVIDARGTGGGWALTITSTQLSTGGTAPHVLPTSASSINSSPTVVCVGKNTCTKPVNKIPYVQPLAVPAGATAPSAVKFFNAAAGSGLGSFTITPTISILIPANTFAGVYSCTVTVTVISGP